jgi:hypothetical protein
MVCEPLMMACGRHRAASLHLYEQLVTDRRCGSGERSVNMRCPMASRRTLNEHRLTRLSIGAQWMPITPKTGSLRLFRNLNAFLNPSTTSASLRLTNPSLNACGSSCSPTPSTGSSNAAGHGATRLRPPVPHDFRGTSGGMLRYNALILLSFW